MQCNWLIALLFLVGIIYVQGQCPPDYVEMYQVVRVLDRALDKVEKYKPGIDPRDADFVVNRMFKDIVTNKKWAPCNDGFRWEDVLKNVKEIRADCYHPADYTKREPQKEFVNCAIKYYPDLLVRYGTPATNACGCFGRVIIPNWDAKYKKYVTGYVDEFLVEIKKMKNRRK